MSQSSNGGRKTEVLGPVQCGGVEACISDRLVDPMGDREFHEPWTIVLDGEVEQRRRVGFVALIRQLRPTIENVSCDGRLIGQESKCERRLFAGQQIHHLGEARGKCPECRNVSSADDFRKFELAS